MQGRGETNAQAKKELPEAAAAAAKQQSSSTAAAKRQSDLL